MIVWILAVTCLAPSPGKYASFATLPLFVAQAVVGQKLYDQNASDATRSAHGALAAGTRAT